MRKSPDSLVLGIPVTSLDIAKSRLEPFFSRPFLRNLVEAMLTDVVIAAKRAQIFDTIFVYSPDETLIPFTDAHDIAFVLEPAPPTSFTACLDALTKIATTKFSAGTLLTCFSDLPLLQTEDFAGCIAMGEGERVVAAPSLGGGCSFFLRSPPEVIDVAYDDTARPSFLSIAQIAAERNIPCYVMPSVRTLWDFDLIEDVIIGTQLLALTKQNSPTLALLRPEMDRFEIVKGRNSRAIKVMLKY